MKRTLWILLALTACTSLPGGSPATAGSKKPDWTDGDSDKYPRERYLVGVGLADDRSTAEERARGEISKIFTAQVSVATNISESETTVKSGGKTSEGFSSSVAQDVKTVSQKALEGVEVVEKWQDPASRQHFALAVLERAKAIRSVRDKLDDFDAQAKQYKGQLEEASGKLQRVKAAMKVLALLKAREAVNADLRVLDLSGSGAPPPFETAPVKAAAAKALGELEVVVDIH